MLFDEVDWGLWHEKNQHFVRYHAHRFFKKTTKYWTEKDEYM